MSPPPAHGGAFVALGPLLGTLQCRLVVVFVVVVVVVVQLLLDAGGAVLPKYAVAEHAVASSIEGSAVDLFLVLLRLG